MPDLPASPVPAPLLSLPPHLRAALPLQGLTVLAVEDSRFASDALRLMCQRAGARLRRAETLDAARAHLRTYRPDVVIVDLGLPDGRGEALIRDLVLSARRPSVILGTSGAEGGCRAALAAGADGFLDKPFESLAAFCQTLRRHLPDLDLSPPPGVEDRVEPDPLALRDDLSRAAALLATPGGAGSYVAGFLAGIAGQDHDAALAAAANAATLPDRNPDRAAGDLTMLQQMIGDRLALPAAFTSRRKSAEG